MHRAILQHMKIFFSPRTAISRVFYVCLGPVFAALFSSVLHAQDQVPSSTSTPVSLPSTTPALTTPPWVLIPEPKTLHHSPNKEQFISGSRLTLLVPATFDPKTGVTLLTPTQFSQLDTSWENFLSIARKNADALLPSFQPEYIRDEKNIIQIVQFHSESLPASALLLSPALIPLLEPILGAEFLIAIPDRFTLLAFPKLASRFSEFSGQILEHYQNSPYPASRELFEVSTHSLNTVGIFEE